MLKTSSEISEELKAPAAKMSVFQRKMDNLQTENSKIIKSERYGVKLANYFKVTS